MSCDQLHRGIGVDAWLKTDFCTQSLVGDFAFRRNRERTEDLPVPVTAGEQNNPALTSCKFRMLALRRGFVGSWKVPGNLDLRFLGEAGGATAKRQRSRVLHVVFMQLLRDVGHTNVSDRLGDFDCLRERRWCGFGRPKQRGGAAKEHEKQVFWRSHRW